MPSPGIRVQRQRATTQVVTAVTTANVGIAGWFPRGPEDDPQFVTSPAELDRVVGGNTSKSRAYTQLLAYFANGGRRAYVVRCSPSDAVSATGGLFSEVVDQPVLVGNNTIGPLATTADNTTLYVNDGATPIRLASLTLRWRGTGTPVVAARLRNRANDANVDLVDTTAAYEVRINPSTLFSGGLAVDEALDAVVPGTITVSWNPDGAGARTQLLAAPSSGSIASATNSEGSVFTFDTRTGVGSVLFAGTDIPDSSVVAASLTISYTPTTATYTAQSTTGDALTGSGLAAGSINRTTGVLSVTFTSGAKPYTGAPVLATYDALMFGAAAKSPGQWAGLMVNSAPQGLSLSVEGDLSGYDPATGVYSRYTLSVSLYDTDLRRNALVETFEGLSLSDAEDDAFLVDAVNELSDMVVFSEGGYGLQGLAQLVTRARSFTLFGGDGTSGNRTISAVSLVAPNGVQPRTVSITYTDITGVARTITDDGYGTLTGHVDATYSTTVSGLAANSIDYATGTINLRTGYAVRGGTLASAAYREATADTSADTAFGDTTVGFIEGEDGTFDSTQWGRNRFTNPNLLGGRTGVYALDRADDLMNVILPDFAGDLTADTDMIAWAQSKDTQASGPDRFLLLCTPRGYTAARARDYVVSDLNSFSEFAAMYWPWVRIADPMSDRGRKILVPPLGHVAGVISRTDTTRNVSKAPAGTVDGALTFLHSLEVVPSDADLDLVADSRINALKDSRATGRCVWGARTLSTDVNFRYIASVRMTMFLMRSVYNSTFWAAFEDIGPALWLRLYTQVESFIGERYRQGWFRGATPAIAYGVVVDETNNPAAVQDAGEVYVDVEVTHKVPGERITFRFAPRRLTS